jgi:hypothetical protein
MLYSLGISVVNQRLFGVVIHNPLGRGMSFCLTMSGSSNLKMRIPGDVSAEFPAATERQARLRNTRATRDRNDHISIN